MGSQRNRMAVSLALSTALGGTAATAWAQQPGEGEPDPNVTVQARPRPDYSPLGIRAGAFLVFPSLTLSEQFDDNVFATDNGKKSDFATIIAPRITAQSDWTRNALGFGAGVTGAVNYDYSQNNYLDAFATTTGRLDVTRADKVSGFLRVDRLHEGRDDPNSRNNFDAADANAQQGNRDGNLNRYWRGQVDTSYRHDFNRWFTVLGANVQRLVYEEVGSQSENDRRDRNEYSGRFRLGYDLGPRINLFGEGRYSYRDYDKGQIYGGEEVKRNSQGFQGRLGTEVDITGILFGELALTYSRRNFDESQFNDTSGFGGSGALTWNVTPLTTVILEAESDIAETTVQFQGDIAEANFQNSVGLDVTHELLRNVLLNANTKFERDDFQGTSRTDNIWSAGAGVTYLINRNLSLDGSYRFSTRSSDAPGARYDRNIVLVGITAKL